MAQGPEDYDWPESCSYPFHPQLLSLPLLTRLRLPELLAPGTGLWDAGLLRAWCYARPRDGPVRLWTYDLMPEQNLPSAGHVSPICVFTMGYR